MSSIKYEDGIRHLIECHCILPQYKNLKDPVYHKFTVFSVIRDDESLDEKYYACNNCGVIHKVVDICKSEIIFNKDDSAVSHLSKISDFRLSLPSQLYDVMKEYNCDLSQFEHVQFIIDNEFFGESFIILTKEEIENEIKGKMIKFLDKDKFKIESFSYVSLIDTDVE